MKIDIEYKTDYNNGRDPDKSDSILRDYHQLLWTKTLPNGKMFNLTASVSKPYRLLHLSDLGNFSLSSDAIAHSYSRMKNKKMSEIVNAFPRQDIDRFFNLACTIGGYIVFPSNKIEGKSTINMERGINHQIKDRFDLTLECIRRWYVYEKSPLFDCLDRYSDFFQLFTNFRGYTNFFFLEDLVDFESESIRFWLPFEEFGITHPLPSNINEYREYMKNVSYFVNNRNMRIDKLINSL
jgi:hypothetical protein